MRRTDSISVRVTSDVKNALAAAAADDNRSVASLIETLLIKNLEARGYLDTRKAGRAWRPRDGLDVTPEPSGDLD